MLIPKPLQKGDLIGIVAPAGMLADESLFYRGVAVLKEMGFEVRHPRDLWPGPGYLADNDDNRAFEFNSLFKDSDVKGVVTMRGGYGCLRILDKLDLQLISANPKWLIGFSDISILQNYLFSKTGLLSLHGPTLTALHNATSKTLIRFQQSLLGRWNENVVDNNIQRLQGTRSASGRLVGGNLASLVTLLATPFDLNYSGSILFLEDINEPTYKIDRMLTQLAASGKFDKVSGIILGGFSQGPGTDQLAALRHKESVWQRVLDLCPSGDIPIWGDFPAGHTAHNITFPLGAEATMDHGSCTLCFC